MSNLHVTLDEANKHTPKGFDTAAINTRPWKDEQSLSTYTENMELPKAINFVDGTVAPPTTGNLDAYVLIGAGVVDAGWGTATFGDWVRFTNAIAAPITPLAGYLCYDSAAASWMEFDGAVWATFGGGGAPDTNLGTDNLTLSGAATRTYDIDGNELKFIDGANNKIKVTPSGVGVGNVGTPIAQLQVVGPGATNGTTAVLVENNTNADLFKISDSGIATFTPQASDWNFLVKTPNGGEGLRGYTDNAFSELYFYAAGVIKTQITSYGSHFRDKVSIGGAVGGALLEVIPPVADVSFRLRAPGGGEAIRTYVADNYSELYLYASGVVVNSFTTGNCYFNGGNVGFGFTAAPAAKVHIKGTFLNETTGAAQLIKTTDSSEIGFYTATPVARATTGITAAAFVANTSGIVDDTATFGGYTGGQIAAALQAIGILT